MVKSLKLVYLDTSNKSQTIVCERVKKLPRGILPECSKTFSEENGLQKSVQIFSSPKKVFLFFNFNGYWWKIKKDWDLYTTNFHDFINSDVDNYCVDCTF
jgi:hypothetical protein